MDIENKPHGTLQFYMGDFIVRVVQFFGGSFSAIPILVILYMITRYVSSQDRRLIVMENEDLKPWFINVTFI